MYKSIILQAIATNAYYINGYIHLQILLDINKQGFTIITLL